ncbi:MAG: hypothetical protein QXW83_00600 [Nitrososphaerales archaeon]
MKVWKVNFRINEIAYKNCGKKAPLITKYIQANLVPREKIYDWVWSWCEKNLGGTFDFRITSVKLVEVDW